MTDVRFTLLVLTTVAMATPPCLAQEAPAPDGAAAAGPAILTPTGMVQVTMVESSYPHWSPAGDKLVFHSNRNGDADIYIADLEGTAIVRLTDDPGEDYTPVWSPDGRRIAFQSDRDGNREVYVMNGDGSGLRNLTSHPAEDSHPKWSPDGTRIIFDSDRDGLEHNYEIYEIDIDGGQVRRLTEFDGWDTYSSIGPDGRRIVWRRVLPTGGWLESGRNSEVFAMNRDGSNPENLTRNAAFDGWPAWSPDGRRIAFASDRDGPRAFHVYVMNADGSRVTRITPDDPGAYFTRPAWSPDGTRVAVNRSRGGIVDIVVVELEEVPSPPLSFRRVAAGALVRDGGQSRGVAWGDFDGDGDPDLYVANTGGQWNFLYRNDRGTFTKLREAEPVVHRGFSEAAVWVDFDNDGDLDLQVLNTDDWEAGRGNEPNHLFRNDGESEFVQVLEGPLATDRMNSVAACWADYDGDGDLDAFIVNRGGEDEVLYRNAGDGQFVPSVWRSEPGTGGDGRSCAVADIEGDGDLDLFVGNFGERNMLYRNRGDGTFDEVLEGELVTLTERTYGISFADWDNDGDLDVLVTNIGRDDHNRLYRNDGTGSFVPVPESAISTHSKYTGDGGGASKGHTWGDFDNDGDLDLYIANGTYVDDMANFLYRNDGDGTFIRIREGIAVADADTSAGTAWADVDRDGDLDLLVANWGSSDQENALYRNETAGGNWVAIRLAGQVSNRFGVGARVRIKATIAGRSVWQTRWLLPTAGYGSHNDLEIHIGLGDAHLVEDLEVHWPSGTEDRYTDVEANRFWVALEGEGLSPQGRSDELR